jgi:hypothetical protein
VSLVSVLAEQSLVAGAGQSDGPKRPKAKGTYARWLCRRVSHNSNLEWIARNGKKISHVA